jgi:hypothetical protein
MESNKCTIPTLEISVIVLTHLHGLDSPGAYSRILNEMVAQGGQHHRFAERLTEEEEPK